MEWGKDGRISAMGHWETFTFIFQSNEESLKDFLKEEQQEQFIFLASGKRTY